MCRDLQSSPARLQAKGQKKLKCGSGLVFGLQLNSDATIHYGKSTLAILFELVGRCHM